MADLSKEPTQFYQGETVTWERSVSEYPAGGSWDLFFEFVALDGTHNLQVQATASGSAYAVALSSVQTAAFSLGDYRWRCYVSDGGSPAVVHHIAAGRFEVLDPLATATDRRSWARKALEAVRARIEGRASESHTSYSIGGRSVGEMTHEELLDAESRLEQRLQRIEADERVQNGGRRPRIRYRLW